MFPSKTEQNCCLLEEPRSKWKLQATAKWNWCTMSFRLTNVLFFVNKAALCTRTDPVASSSGTTNAGQWVVQAFRFVIMQIASLRHQAAVQSEFMAFRRRHFDPIFVCLRKDSTVKVANYKMADPGGRAVWRVMSAASRLLGFGVRILPGAWMSVSCECCVVSGTSLRRADHSSRGVIPSACVNERHQVYQQPSTLTMSRYKRCDWGRR